MNVCRFRFFPLLLALATLPAAAVPPRFARTPDVKGDTVVFAWEFMPGWGAWTIRWPW